MAFRYRNPLCWINAGYGQAFSLHTMGSQLTKAIRDQRAEGGAIVQAGEPLAVNRAAWPSGPLLARTVVSHRSGPAVIYDPTIETTAQPVVDAG